MRLRVLGSAAGGGFPQWNCACPNCVEVRGGSPRLRPRTQDALALEAAPGLWFLLEASPDVHRQIEACPDLQPRSGRATPINGVVLLNGDLAQVMGLFSLRELGSMAGVREAKDERILQVTGITQRHLTALRKVVPTPTP